MNLRQQKFLHLCVEGKEEDLLIFLDLLFIFIGFVGDNFWICWYFFLDLSVKFLNFFWFSQQLLCISHQNFWISWQFSFAFLFSFLPSWSIKSEPLLAIFEIPIHCIGNIFVCNAGWPLKLQGHESNPDYPYLSSFVKPVEHFISLVICRWPHLGEG